MFTLFRTPQRMEDLALFSRHVAGAMRARVPLPDILRAYLLDSETSRLSRAVDSMIPRIETGVALSAAMEDHPKVFPTAFRRLVRLGEQGKTLSGVMDQLSDSLENSLRFYEYFRRAAIYPLMVMIILFIIVSFIGIYIMPKFDEMFSMMGMSFWAPMKYRTAWKILFTIMNFLLLLPIAFLLAAALGLRLKGFGMGRMALQMPLIGPVLRQAETARFAGFLSLLLQNRIPLGEALGLLADSSSNTYVQAAIEDFHDRFKSGEKLGDLIAHQPLFPASMAVMVAAAEDQGALADTLGHLGRFYGERTAHGFVVIREVFEPLALLLIGIMVALVLSTIFIPLFEIPKMIR